MAGEGEEIDAERLHVQGERAGGLHGIGVNGDTARAGEGGDRGERVDRADLVIGEHDADEAGVGAEGGGDHLGRHLAGAVHGDTGDGEALRRQFVGGVEDSVVLDRGDDEVWA